MTSPYLNIIKKMRTAKELFAELNSFDDTVTAMKIDGVEATEENQISAR